jgi:hypothetical protein
MAEKRNQKLIEESKEKQTSLEVQQNELNKYITTIEQKQIEDRQREWTSNSIAQFSEILRNTNVDISEIYQHIIHFLVKNLDMNQGSLFVTEENSSKQIEIELKATYAYNRKKYLHKIIQPGEGLVGQCFFRKRI